MRQRTSTIVGPGSTPVPAAQRGRALAPPAFGRRDTSSDGPTVQSCSRLDFVRAVTAEIVAQWQAASPAERPNVLMRLRIAQDQIRAMRINNPRLAERSSRYAWVDHWSPSE